MSASDPATIAAEGKFEFPGGRLEANESSLAAAIREFQEETGFAVPRNGDLTGHVTSSDGKYELYIVTVPSEDELPIFGDRDAYSNPDDPDGDHMEALAWFAPEQLRDNPSIREEIVRDADLILAALGEDDSVPKAPTASSKSFNPAEHRVPGGGGPASGGGRFAPGQVSAGREPAASPNAWVSGSGSPNFVLQPSSGHAGEPQGMPSGWIPENKWLEGQAIWEARGEAIWAAHEWRSRADGPLSVWAANIHPGDVWQNPMEPGTFMMARGWARQDPVSGDVYIPESPIRADGKLGEHTYNLPHQAGDSLNVVGRSKPMAPEITDTGGIYHPSTGDLVGSITPREDRRFSATHRDPEAELENRFQNLGLHDSRQKAVDAVIAYNSLKTLYKEAKDAAFGTSGGSEAEQAAGWVEEARAELADGQVAGAIRSLDEAWTSALHDENYDLCYRIDTVLGRLENGGPEPVPRTSEEQLPVDERAAQAVVERNQQFREARDRYLRAVRPYEASTAIKIGELSTQFNITTEASRQRWQAAREAAASASHDADMALDRVGQILEGMSGIPASERTLRQAELSDATSELYRLKDKEADAISHMEALHEDFLKVEAEAAKILEEGELAARREFAVQKTELAAQRDTAIRAAFDRANEARGITPGGEKNYHWSPEAQQRVDSLAHTLSLKETGSDRPGQGAIGDTRIATFADGSRAVIKIQDPALNDREEAGYLVAHALGINAPVFIRNSPEQLGLEFVDGTVGTRVMQDGWEKVQVLLASDQGQRIGMLDRLTGQQDRNSGNWLERKGEPVPIDHGYIFAGI